ERPSRMSSNQRRKKALIAAICAMKGGLRLAQSILPQPFEQIGIFARFSSRLKADLGHCEKPDSALVFSPRKRGFCGYGKRGSEALCARRNDPRSVHLERQD